MNFKIAQNKYKITEKKKILSGFPLARE